MGISEAIRESREERIISSNPPPADPPSVLRRQAAWERDHMIAGLRGDIAAVRRMIDRLPESIIPHLTTSNRQFVSATGFSGVSAWERSVAIHYLSQGYGWTPTECDRAAAKVEEAISALPPIAIVQDDAAAEQVYSEWSTRVSRQIDATNETGKGGAA